jgi:predicted 2-oxoglutarate/Fe(II)-dependent dioxygenase YbiX
MDISVYDDFFVISNVLSVEDIETIHSVYKPIDIGHQSNTSHWIVESDKKTRIEAYNREVTIIGIKENALSFISDKIKECFRNLLDREVTLEYPHYYTQYTEGGFHSLHIDAGIDEFDRQYAIILHLSDPGDYEGGDLIVNDVVTPKEKGIAIVFDGRKPHEVTTVTKGERFIISECIC